MLYFGFNIYCAFIDFDNILILKNNFNDKQGFYAEIYNIKIQKRTPVMNKNKNVLIVPMIKQKHQTFILYKKDTNDLVSVNNFPYFIAKKKYI